MVATEVCGMLGVALGGCLGAVLNAMSEETEERFGLPFFYLYGVGSVLASFALMLACLTRGAFSKMGASCWKWVVMRGLGGTLMWLAQLAAIALGAPLGDTSALSCINVVLAALLGRAFLGEPLRALHALALSLSFSGAVMVSQPEFLFGGTGSGAPLAGYAMALASGVFSGCTFIAARRAQDVDPVVLTAAVLMIEGLACLIIPQAGSGPPSQGILESPLATAAGTLLCSLIGLGAAAGMSIGSQLCPAAASSTIFSASSMALGYFFETVLHGEVPRAMTVAGALMMLLAVAIMALARWVYSPRADTPPDDCAPPAVGASAARDDASSQSSSVSLALFVASELSGVSVGRQPSGLRQRAGSAGVPPVARTLGLASA